jgi:hypothetical protein
MGLSSRHVFNFPMCLEADCEFRCDFLIENFGSINFLDVRPLVPFGVLNSTSRALIQASSLNSNNEGYVASLEEDIAACSEHEADE